VAQEKRKELIGRLRIAAVIVE